MPSTTPRAYQRSFYKLLTLSTKGKLIAYRLSGNSYRIIIKHKKKLKSTIHNCITFVKSVSDLSMLWIAIDVKVNRYRTDSIKR